MAMAIISLVVFYLSHFAQCPVLKMLLQTCWSDLVCSYCQVCLSVWGAKFSFFYPLTYIDFSSVLSGDLAKKLGNTQIDLWYAIAFG